MFRSVMVYFSGNILSAISHRLKRGGLILPLAAAAMMMMACPSKKTASVSYDDAERGLRLAINVNEVAYNSWNTIYDNMGQLHRNSKISEARWAAINAIDGVIVLSEADLIEGIERSKKLLAVWQQAKVKVLSAESQDEVNSLRERETAARRNFENSIEFLNLRSMKLRDSYVEALNVSAAVARDGNTLSAEAMNAIRGVIRLVDEEINRISKGKRSERLAGTSAPATPVTSKQAHRQKPVLKNTPKETSASHPVGQQSSRARSVARPEEKKWTVQRP